MIFLFFILPHAHYIDIDLTDCTKDKEVEKWDEYVQQQLDATEGMQRLQKMRQVVQKRMDSLRAFGSTDEADPPDVHLLSPDSKQLRKSACNTSDRLDSAVFKSYEKRLSSYASLLGNATERLVECHKEECAALSFAIAVHCNTDLNLQSILNLSSALICLFNIYIYIML